MTSINTLGLILGALSVVGGGITALTVLVSILSGAASMKYQDGWIVRAVPLGATIAGLACTVIGCWLLTTGHPWGGAVVGGFPIFALTGVIIWGSTP